MITPLMIIIIIAIATIEILNGIMNKNKSELILGFLLLVASAVLMFTMVIYGTN